MEWCRPGVKPQELGRHHARKAGDCKLMLALGVRLYVSPCPARRHVPRYIQAFWEIANLTGLFRILRWLLEHVDFRWRRVSRRNMRVWSPAQQRRIRARPIKARQLTNNQCVRRRLTCSPDLEYNPVTRSLLTYARPAPANGREFDRWFHRGLMHVNNNLMDSAS